MAGPILIFDKSTLQGLNLDESAWLDNFYLSNITPLFFIETLGDLEKTSSSGRTPDDVVRNLADKTPDMNVKPNVHHMALITSELLGVDKIDMRTGRPHIAGGKPIELEGRGGVMFEISPEEESFQRWQKGDFKEIERSAAKSWRETLNNINLEGVYSIFKERLPEWHKPKNLKDVKDFVDSVISHPQQENVLRMAFGILDISEDIQKVVIDRWRKSGSPEIKSFAPYFTYVFSVDLFFYFAIASDLIGRGRASHKVDVAYLYYLPFCMVFSSNDNLHKNIVPFFLRENQSFVSGVELKNDLNALDVYYGDLPDTVKDEGMMRFAFYPPDDTSFLISRLWDKHMNPKWRQHKKEHSEAPKPQKNDQITKPLFEAIRNMEKGGSPMKPFVSTDSTDQPNHMVIKRSVRARKGKWERFPPEVRNRVKNENGEWEDIKP